VEVLPETLVPMVAGSRYLLTITDLPAGTYELRCEDQPLGTATAEMLAKGVNLNELARAPGQAAPWAKVATEWWEGRGRDQIGRTKWRFEVRRK
jgi:hypothetical protein